MFSSPIACPCVEKHPSPSFSPLQPLFGLSEISPSHTHTHTPGQFSTLQTLILSIFLSPPRHAPALMWELRHYACGVVALAWGSALRAQRGASPLFFLPLANRGHWAVCWAGKMNSWRIGGQWGPTEATEVTTIQNPGSGLKGRG